ncbi:hypothetical protein [Roseicitreum antarcticum]|uniref:Uncharacterized protein n=1 Tax=Roseicitreum antarcticum TaxID=564137 RepID=A0A1H2WCS7_9RHOB|nr:hypothetical protein [Roseicitreum antarcticum]SDW78400.1 hypothetical protein SAMN04488238_103341 [Roseicitreum antarcticum]
MPDATFYAGLKLSGQGFRLSEAKATTRLAGGDVIPSKLGAALWQGMASIRPEYHADAGPQEVALMRLNRPGETFLVHDKRYNGPRMDPGGVILGASTPVIHTLDPDNRRIRVSGLPSGYTLSVGDWIGWQYGAGPVRHALHRIETGAVASGAGLTPLFAVEPFIRPGVLAGAPVVLVRPACKAIILETTYGNGAPLITSGASFNWTQTLR